MEIETQKRDPVKVRKPAVAPAAAGAPHGDAPPPTSAPKKARKKVTSFTRQRQRRLRDLVSNYELVSTVCHRHVMGATPNEIRNAVREKFPGVNIKREDPNWIIGWAAKQDWLSFQPPHDQAHRQRILDLWPHLNDVATVASTEVEVVARQGARMLMRMMRSLGSGRETVHVGLAGGHTIRALMHALAAEMVESVSDMPKRVHFHALAAGFDPDEPSTSPNAFVTFFDTRRIPTKIRFTGLSAPAIVSPATFEELKGYDGIKEAFDFVENIDIIVTSGSSWHEHNVLRKRLGTTDRKILEEEHVKGDLLWRPISKRGPIEAATERRAFTLIELKKLNEFVTAKKQVLVTLAPCGICRELKGDLLWCILTQRCSTNIVVDTLSSGQLLSRLS